MSNRVDLSKLSVDEQIVIKSFYTEGIVRDSGFVLKRFLNYTGTLATECYNELLRRKSPTYCSKVDLEKNIKLLGLCIRYLIRNTDEGNFIRKYLNPNNDAVRWGCQTYGLGYGSSADNPYSTLCKHKQNLRYAPYMFTDGGENSFFIRLRALGSIAFMYVDLSKRNQIPLSDKCAHALVILHKWLGIRENIAQLNFGDSDFYLVDVFEGFRHNNKQRLSAAWYRWNRAKRMTTPSK